MESLFIFAAIVLAALWLDWALIGYLAERMRIFCAVCNSEELFPVTDGGWWCRGCQEVRGTLQFRVEWVWRKT